MEVEFGLVGNVTGLQILFLASKAVYTYEIHKHKSVKFRKGESIATAFEDSPIIKPKDNSIQISIIQSSTNKR